MQQASTVVESATFALRAKNFAASAAFTIVACAIYGLEPWNRKQLDELYGWFGFSFTGSEFLFRAALGYISLLLVYFLFEPRPRTCSAST